MNSNVRNAEPFMSPLCFRTSGEDKGPCPTCGGNDSEKAAVHLFFHRFESQPRRALRPSGSCAPRGGFFLSRDNEGRPCAAPGHTIRQTMGDKTFLETSKPQKKGNDMSIWIILLVIVGWVFVASLYPAQIRHFHIE